MDARISAGRGQTLQSQRMKSRHAAALASVSFALIFSFVLDRLQLRFFTWLGKPWLSDVLVMLTMIWGFLLAQHYILKRWTADGPNGPKQSTKPWH